MVVDRVARAPREPGELERGLAASWIGPFDAAVGAIATDGVFHREIVLPFSDLRKLERAAPLEAEESLPLPLEELVCDVQLVERGPGKSRVMVVASPVANVERLLAELKDKGCEPSIVDVEALALANVARRSLDAQASALVVDIAPDLCQAVLLSRGVVRSFHAFGSASGGLELAQEVDALLAQLEAEIAPDGIYLSGPGAFGVDESEWNRVLGLPVQKLPFAMPRVQASAKELSDWPSWAIPLGLALRAAGGRSASQVNLLRGPFALSRGEPPWRQTAKAVGAYAAILMALWGVTAWMEASQLDARRRALEGSIRQTFRTALPDVRNIVSEADQLRTRVSALEERDRALAGIADLDRSPLRILRELSTRISRDTEVELRDLSIDGEKVRIEGSTTSYRASERIKSEIMAASPRFSSASSEARDGAKPGEVLFTLSVNLGEKRP